ncbi:MAG: inositol monophosphatase [Elusimicrobiaceae bacterium]|nr:inositol monophosphatase [Elusimicrobiaceae bacterium]
MKRPFSVLQEALHQAADVVKQKFGKVNYQLKGKANLVTAADLASQKTALAVIKRYFPSHDFLAEEDGERISGSPYIWVIDPIDGTTNFAHSFPQCSVSIALFYKNKPIAAGVKNPITGETFLAQQGKGATLNGKKIHVSKTAQIGQSLLVTGFPYNRFSHMPQLLTRFGYFLDACHDVRRLGSAALDLCWVAAGRIDGYWEENLNPWDVAAGILILQEAGGKATRFDGKPFAQIKDYGQTLLASNGKIHPQMRQVLNRADKARFYPGLGSSPSCLKIK